VTADPAMTEPPAVRSPGMPVTVQRVAVVDDHPTNLLVMQQQLAWFGIEADCYPDGRALLAAGGEYDLLFIDFSMPHPDGVTLAKIIRRAERNKTHRCRIVMCSADADILASPQVAALTDKVLLKPVTLQEIEPLLAQASPPSFDDLSQRLWELAGQDQTFFSKLQKTLQQTLREDSSRLTAALAGQEWEKAEKAAHRLKGSWQMLGYGEGEKRCQQIIGQCRAQQQPAADLNLLISLTESLLTELESYGAHPF
ncbi:response regulator, partial [Erwinia sp.]|uniref:response regulator n=1 Tax=Erwinia citreus TaxID=558 RepID=UPI003C75F5BE